MSGPGRRGRPGDGSWPRRRSRVRSLARWGEELAARHLRARGLEILDRNWRSGRSELDLVARDGEVVAFVEVKTRSGPSEDPLAALGRRKRRELRRGAERWIHAHPGVGREFRFDAVSVVIGTDGSARVEHVRSAFFGEQT